MSGSLVARAHAHVRRVWPTGGAWMPLVLLAWPIGCLVAGELRPEHVVLAAIVPLLAYFSAGSRRLFLGLLPFAILGIVYDAMRYVKTIGIDASSVHVCDLRALDIRIASVTVDGVPGSVHDWLQAHPSPALDLFCAFPYATFIYASLAFAIFLYVRDYARLRAFGWTFLAVNVAGFVTYHLYPAAPPWYFHAHGCAVDLATRASEGPNLARVDALLGVRYFAGMYGRSADVFGAVPSLHVAYPTLIVLFGWPVFRWPLRVLSALFLASMCFAAVYLDHHWIFDVLVGLTYTVTGFVLVRVVLPRLAVARLSRTSRAPRSA